MKGLKKVNNNNNNSNLNRNSYLNLKRKKLI